MRSGALTDKEKLSLEERTALLINLAGVTVQETLSVIGDGISTRKFYKILANTVIDWHWLSKKDIKKYKLLGAGNLVWVPHRFGALGQINPAIEYEQIELHYGCFANMAELFKLKPYVNFGYRDTVEKSGQRYYLFPPFISLEVMSKSRVEAQEQHFWRELVKIYSRLNDTLLDALSSCRTATATFHSLWIQFVMWKRYMGGAIDILRKQHPVSLNEMKKKELLRNIESSRACIKQIFVKIDYYKNINKHIADAQEYAINTEFGIQIPCVDELDSSIASKLSVFIELSKALEALHDICREFQVQLGLDSRQEDVSYSTLESNLKYLENALGLHLDLIDFQNWHSLFLQDGARKETARLILTLIESSFKIFEKRLDLRFERPTSHYENFLDHYYPFPRDHFIPGN